MSHRSRGSVLLLFLISFSWSAASALSIVKRLPGFDGPLPFNLETGYVEVDEKKDAHIFYMFVESESSKPKEDPLIVWLTGGPGCSCFTGFFFEIGPLYFDLPGYSEGLPTMFYNPYTWTKVCNIIFLDSPVGTGFSYSNQSQGYEIEDSKAALDVYTFIRKWFMDRQEFLSNPLYIGGDSYSGMVVPQIAQLVANGNEAGGKVFYNLKGYLVGNPVTDGHFDSEAVVPYAHSMGLISDELYKSAKINCGGEYAKPSTANCENSLKVVDECLKGINYNHILEPLCSFFSPKPHIVATEDRRQLLKVLVEDLRISKSEFPLECRSSGYRLAYFWANNDTVREALSVRKGTVPNWNRCNFDIPYTFETKSAVGFHRDLTSRGYRALIYSGDHDMIIPHVGTQAWIRALNFSIVDDWRPWSVDGQVGGFTRRYSNKMTFATVKGGGHTAPEYKPKDCQAMIARWLSEVPL